MEPYKIGEIFVLLPGIPARTNRGHLGYCSISIVPFNDDGWILFDTGCFGDRELLLSRLNSIGVSPEDVRYTVLSHSHYDHCLNLPVFENSTVVISRAEREYVREVQSGSRIDYSVPECFDELLQEHEVVQFQSSHRLNDDLTLFETPGHTPGGISLLREGDQNMVICGDAVKNAYEFVYENQHSVYETLKTARDSIRKIKDKGDLFIPGHDRPFARASGGGIRFVGDPLRWEVRGDLYPGGQDISITALSR